MCTAYVSLGITMLLKRLSLRNSGSDLEQNTFLRSAEKVCCALQMRAVISAVTVQCLCFLCPRYLNAIDSGKGATSAKGKISGCNSVADVTPGPLRNA